MGKEYHEDITQEDQNQSWINHDTLLRDSNCWDTGIIIVGDPGIVELYRLDSHLSPGPYFYDAQHAFDF
jgi:hypothetical protein